LPWLVDLLKLRDRKDLLNRRTEIHSAGTTIGRVRWWSSQVCGKALKHRVFKVLTKRFKLRMKEGKK